MLFEGVSHNRYYLWYQFN